MFLSKVKAEISPFYLLFRNTRLVLALNPSIRGPSPRLDLYPHFCTRSFTNG